ncbi:MAG: YfiR family protein [Acidobacteria bacterium]|nr:YfiR family protein [Acidobacteriota bacterium]
MKAAFLLNFTKFVEWPSAAFPAPDTPITICVLGEDPFGPILDRTVAGESVNGRAVRARRSVPEANPQGCHVAFISRSERGNIAQINSDLRGSRALTVSEVPGFADAGGMIEFVIEGGKVRFYINAAAAEAAGLKLSSRLLRVATAIKGLHK